MKGWIHSFLRRYLDVLQECCSIPFEDTRLMVSHKQLEQHINIMKLFLAKKCWELVFNLDEVNSSEWDDQKPKQVIVPQNILADDMYYSISRRYRHVTFLACVSVTEDVLMPMIISEPPVRDSLWTKILRQDENVMIRQWNPAYVNKDFCLFLSFSNIRLMYSFCTWSMFVKDWSSRMSLPCCSWIQLCLIC
jgi:hypothetical protein